MGGHAKRGLGWTALLLGALALRVWALGRDSLWVDEAYTVKNAALWGQMSWAHLLDNLHGPLHAAFLHYWTRVAGTGEAALRWPSALASVATIPLLWDLARRLFSRRVAWACAVALALSPFAIWYAREARNYAFFMFFSVLTLWAWQRATEQPGNLGRWAFHGLALSLAFLSNLAAFLLVAVEGAWLLLGRRGWAGALAGWLLAALLLLPWEIRFYEHRVAPTVDSLAEQGRPVQPEVGRSGTWSSPWGLPFTLYAFAGGYTLGPPLRELHERPWAALGRHVPVLAAGALLFGLLVAAGFLGTGSGRQRLLLLAWLLVPPLGVWLIASVGLKALNPRYAMAAFPAFLLLLGRGWTVLPGRWRRVTAVGVLALWALSWWRVQADPAYAKEDYRSAAAWLRPRLGPETLWVTVGVDDPLRVYYLRDLFRGKQLLEGTYMRLGSYPRQRWGEFWETARERAQEAGRLVVLWCRDWHLDPEDRAGVLLREACGDPSTRTWPGIRVGTCPPEGGGGP
jgi:4-amino-4-deoxy-L-arabinose transferase-like glycosyltransferase